MYNMEVENLHCYSVGRNSVLVHNNNGPETPPGGAAPNNPAPPIRTGRFAKGSLGSAEEGSALRQSKFEFLAWLTGCSRPLSDRPLSDCLRPLGALRAQDCQGFQGVWVPDRFRIVCVRAKVESS